MALQPIELISFNLCPFVQRSVITLKKKDIDFKVTYIDLDNKPDWFLDISPLGKVPVVRYGDEILFESAVINEFLDEITVEPLMPTEPLAKARDRGWIEFASQLISDQHLFSVANDDDTLQSQREALLSKLQRLEAKIPEVGYFNGDRFSLVDSALAPLFTRFNIIEHRFGENLLDNFPRLKELGKRYLSLDFVEKSVISDFESVYVDYLKAKNSRLAA